MNDRPIGISERVHHGSIIVEAIIPMGHKALYDHMDFDARACVDELTAAAEAIDGADGVGALLLATRAFVRLARFHRH